MSDPVILIVSLAQTQLQIQAATVELVKADDHVAGEPGQHAQLCVEHLRGLVSLSRPAAYGVFDDLQVEPDLSFEHLQLARGGPTHHLLGVLLERFVDARDKRRDAQRALEIGPDQR
jgi:hypothetical protein